MQVKQVVTFPYHDNYYHQTLYLQPNIPLVSFKPVGKVEVKISVSNSRGKRFDVMAIEAGDELSTEFGNALHEACSEVVHENGLQTDYYKHLGYRQLAHVQFWFYDEVDYAQWQLMQ